MTDFFSRFAERLSALSAAAPAYRLIGMFIVVFGGGGIGVFFSALPTEQRLDALHQDIEQRESMLRALEAQQPLRSTSGRAALQAQLAMYPVWRSTESEHDRLSELVDLAGHYQLETLQLRAAPEREVSSTLLSLQEIRQLAQADVPLEILQHGYRWQLQGSPEGVMRLLDHLTGSAASIDELSVERVEPIGDRSSHTNDQDHSKGGIRTQPAYTEVPVRLDLAFRHFVVRSEDPWPQVQSQAQAQVQAQAQAESLLADAEIAERQSQRDWQTIGWAGMGLPDGDGTGRCIPSAMDYFNGSDEDDSHIFADQQIENITLVGIVYLPARPNTESHESRLRAVFLGRRGELLAAEVGSKVATKGYRLISLNHQQVVLQGPDVDALNNHRVLALHSAHFSALSGVQPVSAKAAVP